MLLAVKVLVMYVGFEYNVLILWKIDTRPNFKAIYKYVYCSKYPLVLIDFLKSNVLLFMYLSIVYNYVNIDKFFCVKTAECKLKILEKLLCIQYTPTNYIELVTLKNCVKWLLFTILLL